MKVIDAEIIEESDGKHPKRILETVADVAEKVAKPFDKIPGGQRYAAHVRDAAVIVRDVDGAIESVKPVWEQIKTKTAKLAEDLGLEDFSDREVLKR